MKKNPRPAVAAVILDMDRVLLVKRGREPFKGRWSVPGGTVEWGEPLTIALKREVWEETGLEIKPGEVAGVFDLIEDTCTDGEVKFHYVIVDYYAKHVGGELHPGDDAEEARWVPVSELDLYELTPHLRERLKVMKIIQ